MKLIFSNHYEELESALLNDLANAPPPPFAPQHIIIPNLAIRRHLELGIARHFGICANLNCAFLAQWLWQQIGTFVTVPAVSPFAPDLLVWRINRLLSAAPLPNAERLNTYLSKADDVMRFELSERISKLFDHYLTYRPEWLVAWSENREADIGSTLASHLQDAAWQAELWRQIISELGLNPFHPAADFFETARHIEANDPRLAALPRTAFIFCLPTMPQLYIRLLEHLSRWIDLRLYLLNPCREYWVEIVDARRLSSLAQRGQESYHETGNQLLANWGKQTQAQIDLLFRETSAEIEVDDSRFATNDRPTMLAALQNAILTMEPLARLTPPEDDQSVVIHSCHHLNRQLEVLHDQLLALFTDANPPTPADILVVTPDLGKAAPLIDAVFGTAPIERRIPYTITGRPASQENTIARILLQLLVLPQSRFTASEVFQLLQEPPIARRFDLQSDEQHAIQGWLKQSGIRWGVDANHRLACGFEKHARHTFAEGLQRLFLGYAMADNDNNLLAGLLPCSVGEGSQALVLGRFWLFVDTLQSLRHDLSLDRTPEEWRQTLLALLDTVFEPDDETLDQLKIVRTAIADLCNEAMDSRSPPLSSGRDSITAHAPGTQSDDSTKLPLAVLRVALQKKLDDPARGGVPGGRVTFAAMSSLRGLPYKIICLLGMDDGAYPSASKPVEFDLMAISPKQGDLQRKHDERNIFLDLLLAARDQFIITYSGRSIHDNAPLPPSVLVSELLDQLLPSIIDDQSNDKTVRAAKKRLIIEHPLQAFSTRYFKNTDQRLFSFDTDYCEAARLRATASMPTQDFSLRTPDEDEEDENGSEPQANFFSTPLTPADAAWQNVSLQQLVRFFRNPCRYLLSERLGITLAARATELEDDEPFTLDWDGWLSMSDRLLPLMLKNDNPYQIEQLAAAGYEFPDGKPGELLKRRELARLQDFAAVVRQATANISPEPLSFSIDLDLAGAAWTLSGTLSGLINPPCPVTIAQEAPPPFTGGGRLGEGETCQAPASPQPTSITLIRYRCDDTRPNDYLTTWISHVALCAMLKPGVTASSRGLSLNGEFTMSHVDNATEIMTELLACYRTGLRRPLHFFPKSAWAYTINGNNTQKAYTCWQCTTQKPYGESADPYYRLALRGETDPLSTDFETLAQTIYGPLLDHLQDSRLKIPPCKN